MRAAFPAFLLALLLGTVGCDDAGEAGPRLPVDPDTVAYDAIAAPQFARDVQPLLAARCVFCPDGTRAPAALADVAWERLFYGDPAWSRLLVPFDADGSLLVQLAERLAPDAEIAFPNVRGLQDDEIRFLRRWIAQGAKDDTGRAPYSELTDVVYVCNQDAGVVSVVGVTRHQILRNVDFTALGFGVAPKPHHVAVEPDGSAWYVTLIGANQVVKLTTDLDALHTPAAVLGQIDTGAQGFQKPGMFALDRSRPWLFLSHSVSDLTSTTLAAIDRQSLAFTDFAVLYSAPHAIALTPQDPYFRSRYLLSASLDQNTLLAWDVSDPTAPLLVARLDLPDATKLSLLHFDLAPDGRTAAITSQNTDEVLLIDLAPDGALSLAARLPVGDTPWYPVFSPDGRQLWVPNHFDNTLSVLNVATRTEIRRLDNTNAVPTRLFDAYHGDAHQGHRHAVLAMPHAGAFSRDGRYFFLSNANAMHDNTGGHSHDHETYGPLFPLLNPDGSPMRPTQVANLAVIDTQTMTVTAFLETGPFASGVTIFEQ